MVNPLDVPRGGRDGAWRDMLARIRHLESALLGTRGVAIDASVNGGGSGGGGVVFTDGVTRPTADPSVTVIFRGPDPGAAALDGDEWWPA